MISEISTSQALAVKSEQVRVKSKPIPASDNVERKEETAREVFRGGNKTEIKEAVEFANVKMKEKSSSVSFEVDDATEKVVVKVIDKSTQNVIKQFPSEEFLSFVQKFETLNGMLFNKEG